MPTILDGVRGVKLSASLATLVANVVGTTKRATTYAPVMEVSTVRKEKRAKQNTLAKAEVTIVNREKVAESARDSAEPGAVASLGHPKAIVTRILIWMEAQLT